MNIADTATVSNDSELTIVNAGQGGMNIGGAVTNTDTTLLTNRAGDMKITGTVSNENGTLNVTNSGNGLYLDTTGKLANNGSTKIQNIGQGGMVLGGLVDTEGTTTINNTNGALDISGMVDNNGSLTVTNLGTGMNIAGTVANIGTTKITNSGENGLTIDGIVKADGDTTILNNDGELKVAGLVDNQNGKLNLTNKGDNINITDTAVISNNNNLNILNYGENGTIIDGTVKNAGQTLITNQNGDLNVNGTVDNTNGKLSLANNGNALNIGADAKVTNDSDLRVFNTGAGGVTIDGVIENTESTAITSRDGSILINGSVTNKDGNLNITSAGTGLKLGTEGVISNNGRTVIQNTGNDGMTLDGTINSNGRTAITNTAGTLEIAGTLETKGDLNLTSTGDGMHITENGVVHNVDGSIFAQNTGEDGITIDGTISNASGNTTIMNHAGSVVIGGSVDNSDGKLGITNHGKGVILKQTGKLSNNDDLRIFNYGEDGTQLDGVIENSGDTTIINKAGDLNVDGVIKNKDGNLAFTNTGNALNFGQNAKVSNDSTVRVVNSGNGGLTVDGTITNTKSTAITNNAGQFTVNGKIENTDGNLNLTNRGTSLVTGKDSMITNTNGEVLIQNIGNGGMTLDGAIANGVSTDAEGNVTGTAGTTSITNVNGDLNFNGSIASQKDLVILNDGAKLDASSTSGIVAGGPVKIINNGENGMNLDGGIIGFDSIAVTNRGGDLNINGTLANQNSNMNITNTGNKLNINEDANILNSGEVLIQNTGDGGMDVNGTLNTEAQVTILNRAGALNVNGKVNNQSDSVIISNYGTGLNVGENAEINNDKNVRFVNFGEDGTVMNGNVTSTEDVVQFINKGGELEINGKVTDINSDK